MTDLENGVTSLWLRLDPDVDLDTLLDGVFLDLAPVVLDATEDPVGAARAFIAYAEDVELHEGTNLGIPAADATAEAAVLAGGAGVLAFVVDATTVHDRGASDVQELAHSMHVAATYLRTLTEADVSSTTQPPSWSSATPPPTSSSRPSPSSERHADCGRGCSS